MAEEVEAPAAAEETEPAAAEEVAEEAPPADEEEAPAAASTAAPEEAEPAAAEAAEEAMPEAAAPAEKAAEAPEAALPSEAQEALARLATRPADHAARLVVARAYAAQGQVAEALAHYQHLVTVDEVLSQVVEDLETLAVRAPHLARTYQLLGDALMHQGRLNEALDAYRQALLRLQDDEGASSPTTPR
ncbi:MAG: tetratricopeptide repeat protein [Anaerolineae bacterium]|nr:tetratricopeptide repeat protein [Anaerolineae bacterium]